MANVSKSRSIRFLTPQQLQRKREGDRRSQQQLRERNKSQISELARRIHDLQITNQRLNDQLFAFHQQCKCGHGQQPQDAPQTPSSWQESLSGIDDPLSQEELPAICTIPTNNQSSVTARDHENLESHTPQTDMAPIIGLDPALWPRFISDTFVNDNMISTLEPSEVLPSPLFPETQGSAMHVPRLESDNVYSTLPKHLPPTCPLDRVVIDLVQSRRPYELNGGNIQEFQRGAFPSVKSLLNPTHELRKNPVTSTIVENIIYVMTVHTLPEQIAILYVMATIIRWQISPTEANYDSMPDWLRPTMSQITTRHPAWMDTFPWPKARERLCRYRKYYDQNSIITKLCNESISINWPYEASDMIIQVNGGDVILNPIFQRHIRNLKNWTLGNNFVEVYPEFVDEINIGHSRGDS